MKIVNSTQFNVIIVNHKNRVQRAVRQKGCTKSCENPSQRQSRYYNGCVCPLILSPTGLRLSPESLVVVRLRLLCNIYIDVPSAPQKFMSSVVFSAETSPIFPAAATVLETVDGTQRVDKKYVKKSFAAWDDDDDFDINDDDFDDDFDEDFEELPDDEFEDFGEADDDGVDCGEADDDVEIDDDSAIDDDFDDFDDLATDEDTFDDSDDTEE